MKYLITLTIGVCLLFSAVPAMADQDEDEAAIQKVVEQINAAINNHDAKGMAALWDKSVESWNGSRKSAAHMEYYADLFKRQPSIKSNRLGEIGIILVTPDVAVYKARMDNTGLVHEDGKALPQLKWLGACVNGEAKRQVA